MILTGSKISEEVAAGKIIIRPFVKEQVNPNSYNYRIGDELSVYTSAGWKRVRIPKKGIVLKPHTTYLASTFEVLGSKKYAMSLIGRSSMGRLGLFLQVSANLGHTGSVHCWTLELVCAKPLRIYPFMIIGQISFWKNKGSVQLYADGYERFDAPTPSKLLECKA